MSNPVVLAIYPNNSAVGVPIGVSIDITFDRGIDLTTAKKNVVIYGQDFDRTSGPDSAAWIDDDTGNNPFFLRSPGFQGILDVAYTISYVDTDGVLVDPQPVITSEADEVAGVYKCKLSVVPKQPLAAELTYKVYIIGDDETAGRGVSARSVFDIVPDAGNASTTGDVFVYGGYTGTGDDTVHVKITTSGNIGTAKYKWWYDSLGEASADTGLVTSRRFRRLDNGLQVRFSGSDFTADDLYDFNVEEQAYLASSYQFSFSTGTGSIEQVPETASTSIIGTLTGLTSPGTLLTVTSMTPPDGASNQPLSTRTIEILFSHPLDADTISNSSVSLIAYPASGVYEGTEDPKELQKKLTVSGNKLTIEF